MKLHIDCDCGCDVLKIEKYFDRDESSQAVYYFNMYRSCDKGGFWYRLKCAWEYFRSGEFAYSDMVMKDGDIDEMIEFLGRAKEEELHHDN